MSKLKIAVIISSTRPTRFGDIPAQWILEKANARLKKQNEDIEKQNREMRELAADRNEFVTKYNKVVEQYNDLVKEFTKYQEDVNKALGEKQPGGKPPAEKTSK